MKLQLSVITIMVLCTTTLISSTSKDHEVGGKKNTQGMEKFLNLNQNQSHYEQGLHNQQDTFEKVPNKTSKYTGVCWHKDNKKWRAQVMHNKNNYYGAYFDNEKHAAMSVNLLCDKFEIARKNPMINIKANVIQQLMLKNQTSIYHGVCWHKDAKKWRASLMHNKKSYLGGFFDNEEQAAMKVNLLCDKNGIQRKNAMIIIKPDAMQQAPNQTSQYNGVCWHKATKKWRVQLMHNKKRYFCGYFDNEEQAAMSINLLCEKNGIAHKNPKIAIELDMNKEIKVENENILKKFKDECENSFIKSNDEESCITTASSESQKRKRKQKQKEELIMDDIMKEKVEITTPIHDDNELVEKIQKY